MEGQDSSKGTIKRKKILNVQGLEVDKREKRKRKENAENKSMILYFSKCKSPSVVPRKKKYNRNLSYFQCLSHVLFIFNL